VPTIAAHLPRSDVRRAHGAWVDLVVAVGAGAACAGGPGAVPALAAGTGVAGAFLVLGAAFGRGAEIGRALREPASRRVIALGALVAAAGTLAALVLGAPPEFLAWQLGAAPLAGVALLAARRLGRLSAPALLFGCAAIAVAAPAAAIAGGASTRHAVGLLLALAPFFGWRALALGRRIGHGEALRGPGLRAAGLREARLAAGFALLVTAALRAL